MRRRRAALPVLPEGQLAEQAAQTLVITQLPTLAPSRLHCAEQDLHKLPPRWRAGRKAALSSEEDKVLGFLESISNSDSDTSPGCLIHLLPPYSCSSAGGRVTPQEALVRTCLLHLTRTLAEGQVLHSCHPFPVWQLPRRKALCMPSDQIWGGRQGTALPSDP